MVALYYGLGSIFGSLKSYQQYAFNKRNFSSGAFPINDVDVYLWVAIIQVVFLVLCILIWFKSDKIVLKIFKGNPLTLSVNSIKELALIIMSVYFIGIHGPGGVFAIFSLIERIKSNSFDSIFLYEQFWPNLVCAILAVLFGYFTLKGRFKFR